MKIQKFEKYNMDIDNGSIAEEYAKSIISKYIDTDVPYVNGDDANWHKLEKIYAEVIKGDNIEDHGDVIKNEMIDYLIYLVKNVKKIRPLYEIEAEKYNL